MKIFFNLCIHECIERGKENNNIYSLSFLRKVCILVKNKVNQTYLLDFFCSGIQFNLLLSPYPCFISLLYLDLYVLGDDALIS